MSTEAAPRPVRPPARRPATPRALVARPLAGGGWRLALQDARDPRVAHRLTVQANGHVSRCPCTASAYGVSCDHRRDAADVAKALTLRDRAKERLAAGPEGERLAGEVRFAERCIARMGYRLVEAGEES